MANDDRHGHTAGWYAQFGEDRVLAEAMPKRDGLFVEVGAADGVVGSNTLHFEQLGWRGVLVEADPIAAEECRRARSSIVVECAVTEPGSPTLMPFTIVPQIQQLSGLRPIREVLRRHGIDKVETVLVSCRTLDEVLHEVIPGCSPDFVTIDVEGHEWSVLRGFSLDVWRPTFVLIERNFYPDWRILRHMHRHGYAYTRTTGVNDWFERSVEQTWMQMVRAAAPHCRRNARPLIRAALERLRLLSVAERVYDRLRGGRSGSSGT
jgi:FkbM family methyltransferase